MAEQRARHQAQRRHLSTMNNVLKELETVLQQRKSADADTSYVASLHAKGLNKILEKVGEESTETVLAAKDGNREEIIKETADLWFHTMVMLSHLEISSEEVLDELKRRFGLSGLDEKAARKED